jgi:hypothetical protein
LPNLYYHPLGKDWFATLKAKHQAKLKVWSATDLEFHKIFFRDNPLGRLLMRLVLLAEDLSGPFAARYGQYPLFVIDKPR